MAKITFSPLSASHFSYMLKWLKTPHVKKWWDQDIIYTMDLVKEKYGSYVDGYKQVGGINKSIHAYIINVEQEPTGYIQIYNTDDFSRSKPLSDLPQNLGGIDIFIGEEKYLGKNVGSKAIEEFLSQYGTIYSHVFVDPDSNNIAAIKAYEKAGFYVHSKQQDTNETWMLKELSAKHKTSTDSAQIKIRPIDKKDLVQIESILKIIGWADQYVSGQLECINTLSARNTGEACVATINNVVVGFIQIEHHKWNRLSHIHGLVVHPNYRRLGIAKKLVESVEISSKNRGNRGIFVDTPVDNLAGRKFYTSIGFAQGYIMPQFYESELDGVTFQKFFE